MTKKDSKETSQLEKLEVVMKALTRKVLSLENQLNKIKTEEEGRGEEILECTEAPKKLEKDEDKKVEKEKKPETQKRSI